MIATSLSHLTLKSNIDTKAAEAKYWDAPQKEGDAETQNDSQHLIHELYEKVVVLEQKNQELTFALQNLESTIFERTCNGSYIWRLKSFQEKLNIMKAHKYNMFFTPHFYTSVTGYKVCARVNISKNNSEFLSLLLHLVKSENDDTLDWPFEGWISFLLIHPEDPRKNMLEMAETQPNLEAFKRPVSEMNTRSYGFVDFVPIKNLQSFIKNDTITIRIDVKTVTKLDKILNVAPPLIEENLKIHTQV